MTSTPSSDTRAGSHRAVLVFLAALAFALLTARLGVWQLDRAAEKERLRAAQTAQRALPPLDASTLPADEAALSAAMHRTVRLQGQWRAEHTVYLDNRQMHGRPGFFVLTPLALAEGGTVLVQRGWLPRDFQQRTRLAPYTTAAGPVAVVGRIAPWPSRLADLGAQEDGPIRQNLDWPAFAQATGLPLRHWTVVELPVPAASAAQDGLQRDWYEPAVGVDRHHGYAATWFGLSALTAGLYVWFQLLRPWRQRRRRHSAG